MTGEFCVQLSNLQPVLLELAPGSRELFLSIAQLGAAQAACLLRHAGCFRSRACATLHRSQFEVLIDTAREVPHPLSENRVLGIGHTFEQVPIVAHHEQCARPGVE